MEALGDIYWSCWPSRRCKIMRQVGPLGAVDGMAMGPGKRQRYTSTSLPMRDYLQKLDVVVPRSRTTFAARARR